MLVVGAALDFRLRYGRFGDGLLLHAHGDPRELGRNRTPDVALAGDCGLALEALATTVAPRRRPDWLETVDAAERTWWDAHAAELTSESAPLNHYRLGAELDRVLPEDAVVIGDGGDVVAAVSRVLRVRRPGHWLDPGPFGCLGVGPGYALGVGTAGFGGPIVVVMGDGAFGLNGMELDALVRFDVPAVLVVGNDGAWGEIRIPQIGIYGHEGEVATRLAPSRYDRLTEVFGGHAEHVERPEELAPRARAGARGGRAGDRQRDARPGRDGRPRLPRPVEPFPANTCGRHTSAASRGNSRAGRAPDRARSRPSEVVALLELPDALARIAVEAALRRSTTACRPASRRSAAPARTRRSRWRRAPRGRARSRAATSRILTRK